MIFRCGWLAVVAALLAVTWPDLALAQTKRDFVSGPWHGRALFDPEKGLFLGCIAGVPSPDGPGLVWTYWNYGERVEISVYRPPWKLPEGRSFEVTLSVDDAWRAHVPARLKVSSDASRPSNLSIFGKDVQALPVAAAKGRRLTLEWAGARPLSFSLSGAGGMLESLDRCLRRGIALQERADDGGQRASDLFVAQDDAEAFARWADELSESAHRATTLIGLGDGICRVIERLSRGEVEPQFAIFSMGIIVTPVAKTIGNFKMKFAELDAFEPASGERDLGVVLRATVEGLLEGAEELLRQSKGAIASVSRGDWKEIERHYVVLSRSSYLNYEADNVYLTIRNVTRDREQMEYHLNQASRSINLMNVALTNAIVLTPEDQLARDLPALIASSKDHVRNARRWARSGRSILMDRLAEAMHLEESQHSRDRMKLLRAYAQSLDEEEALADQFEAVLAETDAAVQSGTALTESEYWSLAHGGKNSAAALLHRRFTLRMQRRAAYEKLEGG